MSGHAREPGRSVLSRAHALLTAYDADHRQLTLTELSERSGLALSTCHRLVGELCGADWLSRSPDGTYRVGHALFELGVHAPAYGEVRRLALPYLSELSFETGENVQLGVLDNDEVLYLERLVGRRSVPLVSFPGTRLPLHCTGVGKAMLATLPDEHVRRVLSRPLRRFTSHTITAPGALLREVRAIRERGYAFTREEMSLGAFSVAMTLRATDDGAPLAVGVTVRRISRTPAATADRLRRTVELIDAELIATRGAF